MSEESLINEPWRARLHGCINVRKNRAAFFRRKEMHRSIERDLATVGNTTELQAFRRNSDASSVASPLHTSFKEPTYLKFTGNLITYDEIVCRTLFQSLQDATR